MFIRGCGEHYVQQHCCAVCLQPSDTKRFSPLKGTVYAKLDTSVLCWRFQMYLSDSVIIIRNNIWTLKRWNLLCWFMHLLQYLHCDLYLIQ